MPAKDAQGGNAKLVAPPQRTVTNDQANEADTACHGRDVPIVGVRWHSDERDLCDDAFQSLPFAEKNQFQRVSGVDAVSDEDYAGLIRRALLGAGFSADVVDRSVSGGFIGMSVHAVAADTVELLHSIVQADDDGLSFAARFAALGFSEETSSRLAEHVGVCVADEIPTTCYKVAREYIDLHFTPIDAPPDIA
jgi:hypothetical protein